MKNVSFVAIIFMLLCSCGPSKTPEQIKLEKEEKEKAILELRKVIAANDKVKDFTITPANVLYVSVYDDGTRRDGLAQYFCIEANEFPKAGVNMVKIVRFGSNNDPNRDNAYGVKLGESWCDFK